MGKSIKKSVKYFLATAGAAMLLPTILYLTLQLPAVQTYIIRRITNHLSKEFSAHISTGRIHFMFFNRLVVDDILVLDQNNDTLLYASQLRAGIRKLNSAEGDIRLGKISVTDPVFALVTDTTGQLNLNWYLDQLRKPDSGEKKKDNRFSIEQIVLNNGRFVMTNRNSSPREKGIDFSHLSLDSIYAIVEDFRIGNDTTYLDFYNMSFRGSTGFDVNAMRSSLALSGSNLFFSGVQVITDSSVINIPRLNITSDTTGSFSNFTQSANLNILLANSIVSTTDLRHFVPFFSAADESFSISARIAGTVSELRGRDIELAYGNYSSLSLDFDFSGLPSIENAFIYLGINSMQVNTLDIKNLKIKGRKSIVLPPTVEKLGNISFSGSFTGFTTDFVAYGKIRTEFGSLNTDISLRPEENKRYRIKGLLTGAGIDIGVLSGKSDLLGRLNLRTDLDGYAYSFKKFGANIAGRIDSVEINNYLYRKISLDGFFTEKTWDGVVRIDDRNIKLDLLGMFSLKDKLPVFDFTLNLANANLPQLNIDKADSASSLSMLVTSDFRGNSIDNLDGTIRLVNSRIIRMGDTLSMNDFTIKARNDNNIPTLALRTDYVDADIKGTYSFASLGREIRTLLSGIVPSVISKPEEHKDDIRNNFSFSVDFRNSEKLTEFFRSKFSLSAGSYLKGIIIPDSIINIEGKSSRLAAFNNTFTDLLIDIKSSRENIDLRLTSPSLSILGQPPLKDFLVTLNTVPDYFDFSVGWNDRKELLNAGVFAAHGKFEKDSLGSRHPRLLVSIDSSRIYARNNLWKLGSSQITVDSSAVSVGRLYLGNGSNYYLIDGKVSEDPADTLRLAFRGIDINPLNILLFHNKDNDPNAFSLDMKGRLNGEVLLSSVYKNLLLESDLTVSDFGILKSNYGNLRLSSVFDASQKVLDIDASNNLDGKKNLDVSGYYDPVRKIIDLGIATSKLPVDALNPLLRIFASDISGTATGKARLHGQPGNIILEGAVMAENTKMKIDYLQTRYTLNDSIRFDRKGFRFSNVKLADERGNPASMNGYVYHRNFRDYVPDLSITMNDCQVLNTRPKDNELFYGTAFARGVTTIKSSQGTLAFDISARTGRNTRFFIPLNTGMSVSEYSFVSFDDQKHGTAPGSPARTVPVVKPQTGFDINFDLEVTPDAEAQLIFDSKAGDIMKGRGSGNLNISLSRIGDFKMTGDYIIEDGDYLFTLGNIMNKQFSVENGGKIMFNGNLDDAEIDLKAIYKLKASLYDIRLEEKYKERIPVECQLLLSGKLFNPVIGFNIYLPTADEETRSYLRNVVSTEEELSRQFLYLLVMNSFYSDPSFASSVAAAPVSGTDAMKVTTYEMLSSQLSNWLSQISNDFDIGFVYRPGYNDINPQEVEVALSTQLLNDKVVLNGNFDVRGTSQSADNNTNQITGDFDAEIRLTDKLRFKVFNRYNNPYTGKGVDYTQGIGIFFKEDFDRLTDLFRRKMKQETPKDSVPKAPARGK